jgi:hypothetical protein
MPPTVADWRQAVKTLDRHREPDVQVDIDVVDTTRFGKLWAPSSLAEFSALVQWEFLGPGDTPTTRGRSSVTKARHD